MKLSELIEKLKTYPQGYDVELADQRGWTYEILAVSTEPNTNSVYLDFKQAK